MKDFRNANTDSTSGSVENMMCMTFDQYIYDIEINVIKVKLFIPTLNCQFVCCLLFEFLGPTLGTLDTDSLVPGPRPARLLLPDKRLCADLQWKQMTPVMNNCHLDICIIV